MMVMGDHHYCLAGMSRNSFQVGELLGVKSVSPLSNAVALPGFWGSATQGLFWEQNVLERYRFFPVALPKPLNCFLGFSGMCVALHI
jgi:hypothetical protein